jgi:hypothetical protein
MEGANDIARLAIRTCGGQSMMKHLPLERLYRDSRCGALMLPWTAELVLDRMGRETLYEAGERPKPLSEPETRFVHEQIQEFRPQLIVSIHAPYGVLDFDGPSVPPSKLGRLYLDQVGIFPGSLGNYGGVHKGVPVVTVELTNALRTPLDSEMRQMWIDLLRWMSERVAAPAARPPRQP